MVATNLLGAPPCWWRWAVVNSPGGGPSSFFSLSPRVQPPGRCCHSRCRPFRLILRWCQRSARRGPHPATCARTRSAADERCAGTRRWLSHPAASRRASARCLAGRRPREVTPRRQGSRAAAPAALAPTTALRGRALPPRRTQGQYETRRSSPFRGQRWIVAHSAWRVA